MSDTLDLFAPEPEVPFIDGAATVQLVHEITLWLLVNQATNAYNQLIEHYKTPWTALNASPDDWASLGLDARHVKRLNQWQTKPNVAEIERVDKTLQSLQTRGDYIMRLHDATYPHLLKQIDDPPPFLFIAGAPDILQQPQIGMVGSRKPTPAARRTAQQFAHCFAQNGLWVTSGLAQGIDAEAHIGALSVPGGRTIAILGSGLATCYPAAHAGLYQQIVDTGGAVVSEFIPNTPPQHYHFPRRNRIVSGLSLGVLVVEAALQSGSLITARLAAEQGRLVFAIPSHIENEQARGCHHLIREGAILVDQPEQVTDDLQLPKRWQAQELATQASPDATTSASPEAELNPAIRDLSPELQILLNLLDWQGQDMDQLIAASGLEVALLSSQLMELELAGYAVVQAGRYVRCRQ